MRRAVALSSIVVLALLGGCGGEPPSPPPNRGTPGIEQPVAVLPDVVGMTEDEARAALEEAGVLADDIDVKLQESLEMAGEVLSQNPTTGSEATGPVVITVAESIGPVPDFTDRSSLEAKDWADERDIRVVEEFAWDEDIAEGRIISTVPSSGQSASSELRIKVSKAPQTLNLAEMTNLSRCTAHDGDRSVDGEMRPKSVFTRGGANGECVLEYNLGRDWKRFRATVGLDDNSASDASVRFTVYADSDVPLFDRVLPLGDHETVDVDVSGKLRLRLVTTAQGATQTSDYTAVWGNARVMGSSTPAANGSVSPQSSEAGIGG